AKIPFRLYFSWIRVKGNWPMRFRESARWVLGISTWGGRGEGIGKVLVWCRCTGGCHGDERCTGDFGRNGSYGFVRLGLGFG
nr:hypothetical protein [Tanacetum cinerariifolium]